MASKFASALGDVIAEVGEILNLSKKDWADILFVSEGSLDNWLGDVSIPRSTSLYILINFISRKISQNEIPATLKSFENFNEVFHTNSRLISPHGRKLGLTPACYALRSNMESMCLAISVLDYQDQKDFILETIKSANAIKKQRNRQVFLSNEGG